MARHVKGVLYVTYVRMVRGQKHLPWSAHLALAHPESGATGDAPKASPAVRTLAIKPA